MDRVVMSSAPMDWRGATFMDSLRQSMDDFLQADVDPSARRDVGAQSVFLDVFPVRGESVSLDFIEYRIGEPKSTPENCYRYRETYKRPLYATLRHATAVKGRATMVGEDEVLVGHVLVPHDDVYIVKGNSRVVVSQVQRSPGMQVDDDVITLMPKRGHWLYVQAGNTMSFQLRQNGRVMPLIVLLKAFGFRAHGLIRRFGLEPVNVDIVHATSKSRLSKVRFNGGSWLGVTELLGKHNLHSPITRDGKLLGKVGQHVDYDMWQDIRQAGVNRLQVLENKSPLGKLVSDFLDDYRWPTQSHAIAEICRSGSTKAKLGEALPDLDMDMLESFRRMFTGSKTYSLSKEGRAQMESLMGGHVDDDVITQDLLVTVIKALVERKVKTETYSLENRRLRMPGELLADALDEGLREAAALALRTMEENEGTGGIKAAWIDRPVSSKMQEFGVGQLCQVADAHNPFSTATQVMRFTALGKKGIAGNDAGGSAVKMHIPAEARDIHDSHFGKFSTVDTVEGENIGLVGAVAINASVDENGFVEYPTYKVIDGMVTDDVEMLSSLNDRDAVVAYADATGRGESLSVRKRRDDGSYIIESIRDARLVTHIDVSPTQWLSLGAAMIPFMSHDEPARASMGSNMMRQAVPLLKPQAPIVGSGAERMAAELSRAVMTSRMDGRVDYVDAKRMSIRKDGMDAMVHSFPDIISSKGNCVRWRPDKNVGDKVSVGDVLANSSASAGGDLALGQNMRVAFMPWIGYNFEDAVVISERVVRDDRFTSLHIKEFTCQTYDTAFGQEEITDDITDVRRSQLRNLDEFGIATVGARVKGGDILVGKVTPKDPSRMDEMSLEDKMLHTIMDNWGPPVKDTSLRLPPGEDGVVVDVEVLRSKIDEGDLPSTEREKLKKFKAELKAELNVGVDTVNSMLGRELIGERVVAVAGERLAAPVTVDKEFLKSVVALDVDAEDPNMQAKVLAARQNVENMDAKLRDRYEERRKIASPVSKLDDGVLKEVRVKVMFRRRLQIGDKLVGRHGNKSIVSIIVPDEDMPFDKETGEHIDVVLNPMGVPSRMNIGQVLETHLGLALDSMRGRIAALMDSEEDDETLLSLYEHLAVIHGDDALSLSEMDAWMMAQEICDDGVKVASPAFHGTDERDIKQMLEFVGCDASGQRTLVDGRTGEEFDRPVTVGCMYMMKLHHMVQDKMHARSMGKYNRITQQPSEGKAGGGGQRLGEMEVWAIMAYGAVANLQEMLTLKSDHVAGRHKMYKHIVTTGESPKLEDLMSVDSLPESTNLLLNELRALALDVEMVNMEDA